MSPQLVPSRTSTPSARRVRRGEAVPDTTVHVKKALTKWEASDNVVALSTLCSREGYRVRVYYTQAHGAFNVYIAGPKPTLVQIVGEF